jgi:serine/threonine-protein kinase RsbW
MAEVIAQCSRQGPATAETIEAVHADLDRLASDVDFVPDAEWMAFATAVVEAANNVVRHAVPADGAQLQLGVEIIIRPRRLEARISELGAAPSQLEPDGAQMPAAGEDLESGWGLALIRALVSTVTFERQGETNVWVLCKESGGTR